MSTWRHGWVQVVSMFTFYSEVLSSNTVEVYSFILFIILFVMAI